MSRGRRSFNDIMKEFTEYQLNCFSRKIALEYLRIRNGHPRSYITLTYWLSDSCYYSILEYAIVHCTVLDREIDQMENLAIYNQRHNADPDPKRTNARYKRMRKEREEYIQTCKDTCKDEKKKTIAEKYAANEKLSVFEIAMKENLPYPAVSQFIEDAIIESLIDEHIVSEIMWKEINKEPRNKREVVKVFCDYKERRENFKKESQP